MIFPGMDPYLEDPQLWPGIHTSLIVYFRNQLQPLLRPRYFAAIEERVYVEGPDIQKIPDLWVKKNRAARKNGKVALLEGDQPITVQLQTMEIHERYLNIVDRQAGEKIVTVIELISPTNKRRGPGRDSYLAKQKEMWQSESHLVEMDLLRAGEHVLAIPEWVARDKGGGYNYLICVNKAHGLREEFHLYPRKLLECLPRIRIPLAGKDPDVLLDIQEALERTYEDGSYDLRIRYDKPCVPPLSGEDQAWANQLIRKAKAGRRKKAK